MQILADCDLDQTICAIRIGTRSMYIYICTHAHHLQLHLHTLYGLILTCEQTRIEWAPLS